MHLTEAGDMEENILWKGNPSHWIMFGYYLLWLLPLAWGGFGLLAAFWLFLVIKTWRITVTNHRISEEKGVLNKNTNELELYRVKDIVLNEPFLLRLVGLANVVLVTSDRSTPMYVIRGVRNGKRLKEDLRKAVEERRDAKGVVERDYE